MATTEIYTLSLHDALPICRGAPRRVAHGGRGRVLHADRSVGLRQIHAPRHARRSRSPGQRDRKSTRLNSSHLGISYAVFCLKKKITTVADSRCNERYKENE